MHVSWSLVTLTKGSLAWLVARRHISVLGNSPCDARGIW